MIARIGADDVELELLDPQPDLLEEITGIPPEPGPLRHVLLEPYGVRSTQRLVLSSMGGGLILAMWPAELKVQARYLYGSRLATPMINRAFELGWTAAASPHLSFRNAPAERRLYMLPPIAALEYARRWEDEDLPWVGQYERDEVRSRLWPWLKKRGYAESADDPVLNEFLDGPRYLGNRPAFLRPGLRLKRRWNADAVHRAGGAHGLVADMRREVNEILSAAREPPLPVEQNARRPIETGDTRTAAADTAITAPPIASREARAGARTRQPIPEHVRFEVWRRDQGRCVDCGSRERLEFDHIVPISKGGSNTARNIELRCESCNRRKGVRI